MGTLNLKKPQHPILPAKDFLFHVSISFIYALTLLFKGSSAKRCPTILQLGMVFILGFDQAFTETWIFFQLLRFIFVAIPGLPLSDFISKTRNNSQEFDIPPPPPTVNLTEYSYFWFCWLVRMRETIFILRILYGHSEFSLLGHRIIILSLNVIHFL